MAQVLGRIGQHHRRKADQRLERGVAAHHQPGAVVDQHADRAQLEPLVQRVVGLRGLVAGLVLQRHILQDGQQQGRAIVGTHPARHEAEPALAALAVGETALDLAVGLVALGQRLGPLLARQPHGIVVDGQQPLGRVMAQYLLGRPTASLEKGAVGRHDHEVRVLHRQRLGRIPEQAHQVAGRAGGQRRHGRRGHCRRGTHNPATGGAAGQGERQVVAGCRASGQLQGHRTRAGRAQHRRAQGLARRRGQGGQGPIDRLARLAAQQQLRCPVAKTHPLPGVQQQQHLVDAIEQGRQLGVGRQRGMARQQRHRLSLVGWPLQPAWPGRPKVAESGGPTLQSSCRAATSARNVARLTSAVVIIRASVAARMSNSAADSIACTSAR